MSPDLDKDSSNCLLEASDSCIGNFITELFDTGLSAWVSVSFDIWVFNGVFDPPDAEVSTEASEVFDTSLNIDVSESFDDETVVVDLDAWETAITDDVLEKLNSELDSGVIEGLANGISWRFDVGFSSGSFIKEGWKPGATNDLDVDCANDTVEDIVTGTRNGAVDGYDIIDDCVNDADDVCVTNNFLVDCVNVEVDDDCVPNNVFVDCVNVDVDCVNVDVDCVNDIVDDIVAGTSNGVEDRYDIGTRSGFTGVCIKGTSRGPSGGFVTGISNWGGGRFDPTSNKGIPEDCDVAFSITVSKCFDSLNFTSSELLTFLSQYAELFTAFQKRRTLMETKPSCFKINFSTLDWSVQPTITLLICNNRNIKIF